MNKITVHNYEAFLLDSCDGNLTGEERLELDVFMIEHPELAVDLEDALVSIEDNALIVFKHKSLIKKTENDLVNAEQFIGYIEDQLSADEKEIVEKSCSANPLLATELKHYQNTISQANMLVKFDGKESLKRRPKVIWFNYSATQFAAAASIALLIVIYLFWPSKPKDSFTAYASKLSKNKTDKVSETIINSVLTPSVNTSTVKQPIAKIYNNSKNLSARQEVVIQSKDVTLHTTFTNQPDTFLKKAVKLPELIFPKETAIVASTISNPKTTVEVILENDEDENIMKPKKGFWALAGKALNNLNKAGLKVVDGKEQENELDASYALTLGNIHITHSTH